MKFVSATAILTSLASSASSFSLLDGNSARLDTILRSTTDLFGKMSLTKNIKFCDSNGLNQDVFSVEKRCTNAKLLNHDCLASVFFHSF